MRLINNGVLRQGNLMATTISPNLQEIRDRSLTAVHTHWKMLFFIGVLMLFLGILAITLPTFSTLEIDILVGWLLCVGGIARIVTLYGKQHLPGLWWSIFSGFIAIVAGVLLVTRPIQGTMTLTMLLAAYFLIEGITTLYMTFLQRRHSRTRMWTLCGGLINVAMAFLIWQGWPATAAWVIGLYAGVNMIFLGAPLIAMAWSAHRTEVNSPSR
jgi:uncharacterized membrane protein HdeD (DUF308 family)